MKSISRNQLRSGCRLGALSGSICLGLLAGCGGGEGGDPASGVTGFGVEALEATSACANAASPCEAVSANSAGTVVTCRLATTTCGVDLADVISQVQFDVTGDTVMWIEAWGGNGGNSDKACDGGSGGYAQTTTSVGDIKAMSGDGSTQMFYFLAGGGTGGGDHCGSAGGSATIVTLSDLTLNPAQGPSLASPPTLLVAGGAGGGSAGNGEFGCITPGCPGDGADGGVAIASLEKNGEGKGGSLDSSWNMGGGGGVGGSSHCVECGGGNQTDGLPVFGGRGGAGGSGQSCSGPGAPHWINTGSTTLSMISGSGGKGSSNTSTCDAGGGGGGGGWGGGGGGGHANDNGHSIPGGGGGSYAIFSTQSSTLAPTGKPGNPCEHTFDGCVQIQFNP